MPIAPAVKIVPDRVTALFVSVVIVGVALLLRNSISGRSAILFLIGIGLGISLLHASYGFSGSWKQFIVNRNSKGVRSNLLLLAITSCLFFPLIGGAWSGVAGTDVSAALGPVSVSVFVGALLFGIGMQLGGGCGSGTLFAVGQGQIDMLVTLAFFVVGSTIGTAHLDWWLTLPNAGSISLLDAAGWLPALVLQIAVLIFLYWLVTALDKRKNTHAQRMFDPGDNRAILHRLVFGPWSLWWGIASIALLSTLTLLIAGHPWSITFAFGLWGAKIWAALGGDVSWPYWSNGYPAQALRQSVLADTTSVMNFGIVLGALLAAALAGKFAPAGTVNRSRALSAILGGLLLGYGARLGFGCNIGALLAGISTGSLHGWLWLIAAFLGNILGVRCRPALDRLSR